MEVSLLAPFLLTTANVCAQMDTLEMDVLHHLNVLLVLMVLPVRMVELQPVILEAVVVPAQVLGLDQIANRTRLAQMVRMVNRVKIAVFQLVRLLLGAHVNVLHISKAITARLLSIVPYKIYLLATMELQ